MEAHENSSSDPDEEDEEEDQVTDYLEKLSVSVDVVCTDKPNKNGVSNPTSELSSSGPDSPNSPLMNQNTRLNNEVDTISDESGYSEESNPSAKEILEFSEDPKESDLEDLTVTGVLISDFSPSERLKYLQRSQSTSRKKEDKNNGLRPVSPDFLQNKVPEFCINI